MNTPSPTPAPAPKPLFATPQSVVVAGLVVGLVAVLTRALGRLAITQLEDPSSAAALLLAGVFDLAGFAFLFLSLAMLVVGGTRWAIHGKNAPASGQANLQPTLEAISERLLLSDAAKRIAYRQQDLDLLRNAIEEELNNNDYESAFVLAQELGDSFGYREEAEAIRDRIHTARRSQVEAKATEAVARFDQMLQRNDFDHAALEAAKLNRLYPDVRQVQELHERVGQARERYKLDLERAFLEAAEREEVERAMELLKQLDKYLTAEEAAPLQETARGIIGKQRDNLGVRFKLAMQDKDWLRAAQTGEQIIAEFPNSKMADEVRALIDNLRRLATEQQVAQGLPPLQPPA